MIKNIQKISIILGFFLSVLIVQSCSNNPLDVDSSNIKVKIGFYNMDSVFVNSNSDEFLKYHQLFEDSIQDAYYYELGQCLRIGSPVDSIVQASVAEFVKDPYIKQVEERISAVHKDLIKNNNNIQQGFRNLKFHIPSIKTPNSVVYANSCFLSSAFCTENEILIGLERYLGKEEELYQQLPGDVFFEWIKEGMQPKFMERDAMMAWLMTHILPEVDGNLAEGMVRWGKIMYLTEAAFPSMERAQLLRYEKDDFEWAEKNELPFWDYLVREELLFKNSDRDKQNMLAPGPFTVGLPQKGPDRLGQYLGWKMVHSYIESTGVSVNEMLAAPYNEILQEYDIN